MRKSDGFRGDTTSIFINWLQQWSHWPGFQPGQVRETRTRGELSVHSAFNRVFCWNTLTLIEEVLVESVQPVLQLLAGFCAEDEALGPLRWRVDDRQPSGLLTWPSLFNHTDPSVLQHQNKQKNYSSAERNLADAAEKKRRFLLSELDRQQMCSSVIKNPINQTNIQQTPLTFLQLVFEWSLYTESAGT